MWFYDHLTTIRCYNNYMGAYVTKSILLLILAPQFFPYESSPDVHWSLDEPWPSQGLRSMTDGVLERAVMWSHPEHLKVSGFFLFYQTALVRCYNWHVVM